MWLGRHRLGEILKVPLSATLANGSTSLPDSAPRYWIFESDGSPVVNGYLPVIDRYGVTALFGRGIPLGTLFTTGQYILKVAYAHSSVKNYAIYKFEVIGGGQHSGAIIGASVYKPRLSNSVVYITDGNN